MADIGAHVLWRKSSRSRAIGRRAIDARATDDVYTEKPREKIVVIPFSRRRHVCRERVFARATTAKRHTKYYHEFINKQQTS